MNLQVMQVAVQGYAEDGGLHEGQPLVISAEYQNASDHASGPFQVAFVLDGATQHAVDVHDAGPGESQWAQWQTDGMFAGVHHVRVAFAGVQHESEHVSEEYDQEFHVLAAPVAPAAQDGRDEAELAAGYLVFELAILRHWHYALGEFDKVMVSETQEAAKPHFAAAIAAMFGEKILGVLAEVTHADLVIGALKAVLDEGERAKAAEVSVALRDFYSKHIHTISEMDKKLTDAQADDKFVQEVRQKTATLLADGDADGYLAYRTGLIALHDDAAARHQGASQDAFYDALSAEWMNQSVNDPKYDVAIKIRILQGDLSVLDFTVEGPDGDKLTEHLGAQDGGVDLWALPVPRSIAYYVRDGDWPSGWVHVDAANRLIDSPAEQNVSPGFKEVYDRLRAQGHLIGRSKG